MSQLDGVFVSLTTGAGQYAGTDDHVYLGICGTVGGREFALNVENFDDWEEGSVVTYGFGPRAGFYGAKDPRTAADQLDRMTICLPNVTHVYLRKQGDRTTSGDDYWELQECHVNLHSPSSTRQFVSTGTARLGNEYGHKIWLAESFHQGAYKNAHIPVDGTAECQNDGE
ncbi:hypothetical protein NDI54_12210 [Haloarcula sp. S1AR25-5A]|uniref:Uncharacterized protein n=1 Tax=Haloarcula terrestris TaxID=2950533 RepID=A0AAE4EXX8_9EURY|nr:hypothetical protein [Haloarcula terrestris]MDS0222113.1 hypothetical protein [Haloarcula terrestris]